MLSTPIVTLRERCYGMHSEQLDAGQVVVVVVAGVPSIPRDMHTHRDASKLGALVMQHLDDGWMR
jgi:hypothetical protein